MRRGAWSVISLPSVSLPLATGHWPLATGLGNVVGPFDSAMRATLHLPVTRRIKVDRATEWGNPRRTKQLAAFGFTGHRPLCRAGRPSRDLGFLLVSPLELWLCFRPSAPAVSDLSSCDSRLCFDFKLALFGAFWGVVTSSGRHCPTPSPCPGWPAACAPSWDKIPILSFVESSMTRLESCPTIGPELSSVIGSLRCPSSQPPAPTSHCSSPIFSSPPATWSSPSATWHSSFAISHSSSAARHPPSAIPPSPFQNPHSAFSEGGPSRSARRARWPATAAPSG